MKYYITFILCFIFLNSIAQEKWGSQPILSLDQNKNITYTESGRKKTIFPVMLYSFNGWGEAKNDDTWKVIHNWGVNVVFSWDIANMESFLSAANQYKSLILLDHTSSNDKVFFYSFPDEPIGAGTADLKKIIQINENLSNRSLKFINVDVGPYFFRKKFEPKGTDIFKSKLNCRWCSHGKGSTLSYNESVKFADVISFDYYPFRPNGNIGTNVYDYGETSVGEFTRLLKNYYRDKSIWAVIQTLWFDPFNEKYQGNIINTNIIRNLTFDAISNGADGISFFGHGQTKEYQQKKGYEFLKGRDIEIWKNTLYQTYELGQLQTNYDNILLEDNIFSFVDKAKGYTYAVKKAKYSNKYYFFVVNHLKKKNNIALQLPSFIKTIKLTDIVKIGNYNMPGIKNVSNGKMVDYRKELYLNSILGNRISLSLDSYGVGIFVIK